MGWLKRLLGGDSYEPGYGKNLLGRGWNRMENPVIAIASSEPAYDLVGEQQFQDNLQSIVGKRYVDGVYWYARAQIAFQTDNPVDPNAVVVLIEGSPVGHVPAHEAKRVRAMILAVNPDMLPVICKAMICGGFRMPDGEWASYGVKIGLEEPIRLMGQRMRSKS